MLNVTYAAPPYLVRAAAGSPHGVTDQVTISSTTKFGVTGFAEILRQELLSRQVRVSVIGSGTADTELTTYLREEIRQAVQRQTESTQPLLPEDIANAVACVVTRDCHVAVNEVLVRASEQAW